MGAVQGSGGERQWVAWGFPTTLMCPMLRHTLSEGGKFTKGATLTIVSVERWIQSDKAFLPQKFPRVIVLLHPGAVETGRSDLPFAAPNPNNQRLSEAEIAALDAAILDSLSITTPCKFALYGGYTKGPERQRLEKIGLTPIDGRLRYLVGAGELRKCLFRATEEEFGPFMELSYLWAQDESWFVASPPDVDFTAIGCSNTLADRLLADEILETRNYPQLQTGS